MSSSDAQLGVMQVTFVLVLESRGECEIEERALVSVDVSKALPQGVDPVDYQYVVLNGSHLLDVTLETDGTIRRSRTE